MTLVLFFLLIITCLVLGWTIGYAYGKKVREPEPDVTAADKFPVIFIDNPMERLSFAKASYLMTRRGSKIKLNGVGEAGLNVTGAWDNAKKILWGTNDGAGVQVWGLSWEDTIQQFPKYELEILHKARQTIEVQDYRARREAELSEYGLIQL